MISFRLDDEHEALRTTVMDFARDVVAPVIGDFYERNEFPYEIVASMGKLGLFGLPFPEAYGGMGGDHFALCLALHELARVDSSVAITLEAGVALGAMPIYLYGNEEQRSHWLPELCGGERLAAFGLTEPGGGSDIPGGMRTTAVRDGDEWVINGRKVWSSNAQQADRVLILTRTTPVAQVAKRSQGLSLFFAPMDRSAITIKLIDKMGRHAVDSNELFIDNLRVPHADLVGQEGEGFSHIIAGLNPERIVIAAEAVGIGKAALDRAVQYAKERVVFGRPIGQNQGIQFPLAEAYARLEAADLMAFKAAWLYDQGLPCGKEANIAKLLAAEAGCNAVDHAVQTFGGFGYAREFDVERLYREIRLYKIAPVSQQMALNYIGEHVLGMPRSY